MIKPVIYQSKNKATDVINTILLIFILIISAIHISIGWERFGPLTDFSRELVIFQSVAKGAKLLKDIYLTYGPLAYSINITLFKIIGFGILQIQLINLILVLIYILIIYHLLRSLVSKTICLALTAFTLPFIFFNRTDSNFIFPYSYAALWANFLVILGIYFIKRYQTRKDILLAVLSLISALLIMSKFEIGLAFIISALVSYLFIIRSFDQLLKQIIKLLLATFSFFILLTGVYFFNGISTRELIQSVFSFAFTDKILVLNLFSLTTPKTYHLALLLIGTQIIIMILSLFLYQVIKNRGNKKLLKLFLLSGYVIIASVLVDYIRRILKGLVIREGYLDIGGLFDLIYQYVIFDVLSLIIALIIIYFIQRFRQKNINHSPVLSFQYWQIFIILFCLNLYPRIMQNYVAVAYTYLSFFILAGVILLLMLFKNLKIKYQLDWIFLIILIPLTMLASYINIKFYYIRTQPINMRAGTIYVNNDLSPYGRDSLSKILALAQYIKKTSPDEPYLLAGPYSQIFYLLTDKIPATSFPMWDYYSFGPSYYLTNQEIDNIKKKHFKYAVIDNVSFSQNLFASRKKFTSADGYYQFGRDWGMTLNAYIKTKAVSTQVIYLNKTYSRKDNYLMFYTLN